LAGNYLTALRTAAASALSIDVLAKSNAQVLGVIGAGKQAEYQIRAALLRRPFKSILIANRTQKKALELAGKIKDVGIDVECVSHQNLCERADVIISVVSSHQAQFFSHWIRPGTHISAMGTDTKGKQELPMDLFSQASIFTDDIAQSTTIGECQHAILGGIVQSDSIKFLGDVIAGSFLGRQSDMDITIYDGTGTGLQDLWVANVVMKSVLS
jgi:ornithine cyclodeaminase